MAKLRKGALLRNYRKTHGISATEFGRRIGATHPAVLKWEAGGPCQPWFRDAIAKETRGAVPASSLAPTKPEIRSSRRVA